MMENFLELNEKLESVIFETFDRDTENEAKKLKVMAKGNRKEKDGHIAKDSVKKGRNKNRLNGKVIEQDILQKHRAMMNKQKQ